MKKLDILKTWTKILFALCMVAVIFAPGFLIINIINPDMVPFSLKFNDSEDLNWLTGFIVFLIFAGFCCFVYSLYLFRKVLALFSKSKIFEYDVIILLSKTGQFIFFGAVLTSLPHNLYYAVIQQGFSFDFVEFWIIIFTFSLALFLMVLSEVFLIAKNIKEEHDLTV